MNGLPALGSAPLRHLADYIALHARRRPDHPAVISDGRTTTYATLHREVGAMTAALARLGLRPGALVAVAHPDIHPRLLVMLAFERLGVTVAPFRSDEGDEAAGILTDADLVMSAEEAAPRHARHFLPMTGAWLAAALSHAPRNAAQAAAADALLLIRTSGSTGTPKQTLVTRAMLAARTHRRVAFLDLHRHDRFLATMHFTVAAVFYMTTLCLKLGATVVSHNAMGLPETLEHQQPTRMYLLPFHLAGLLSQPGRLPNLPGLTLIVGGGKLAPTLRRQAVGRLCNRVIHLYGANETSMICMPDDDDLGTPLPGLTVEVVGDDGARLPPGVVGEIRVRGAAVATAYHGNPAATAKAFRNGWYYTGDFGTLTAASRLMVLGRRDDVLNFGGIKQSAVEIEAQIRGLSGNRDVAVLAGQDPAGAPVILVCIACAEPHLTQIVQPICTAMLGRFAIYRVDAIPRSRDGKVRRLLLQQDILRREPVSIAPTA